MWVAYTKKGGHDGLLKKKRFKPCVCFESWLFPHILAVKDIRHSAESGTCNNGTSMISSCNECVDVEHSGVH